MWDAKTIVNFNDVWASIVLNEVKSDSGDCDNTKTNGDSAAATNCSAAPSSRSSKVSPFVYVFLYLKLR